MLACAILCGGLARRLGPLTEQVPKSLIPINSEPFLAHQLRLLRSNGIDRAVLCAGFLGEMIREFAGDGSAFGMELSYSFDGDTLLGTAGAIRKALALLDKEFFVLYGDSYLTCDYRAVAASFQSSGRMGLMTIYRNEGSYDSSNVEAADGMILRYDKRNRAPQMRYIDYGLGVFARSVFEALPPEESRDLAEVYQALLFSGELASYEVKERFYEIGSEQGIHDLEKYLAGRSSNSSQASQNAARQ